MLLKLPSIWGDPGFSYKHCQLDKRCLRTCFSNFFFLFICIFSAQIPLVLMGDEKKKPISSFLKS